MFYSEVYEHICISNGLSKKNLSRQKPEVLLAEDETGASSYLSEPLSDLGFHETESSVQL